MSNKLIAVKKYEKRNHETPEMRAWAMSGIHWHLIALFALTMSGWGMPPEPHGAPIERTIDNFRFSVEDAGILFDDGLMHKFDVWSVDAPMPVQRMGKNDAWIYISHPAHPHRKKVDGPHAWVSRVRCAMTDGGPVLDVSDYEAIESRGIPNAGPERNGWIGWMMHRYDINPRESLAVFHYEDQHADMRMARFRLGVAYSADGGKSYDHLGFAISTWCPDPTEEILKKQLGGHVNISGTGVRVDDDYIYYYFLDSSRQSALEDKDPEAAHLAVARAPKKLLIENARRGKNTEWHKYHENEWKEPGLGGRSACLGKMTEYHTSLMYNSHINKWITFNVDTKNRTVCMRRSSDPLDFNVPDEPVFSFGRKNEVAYTSFHSLEPDFASCGKEFYIYFRNHGTDDATGKAFYHIKKLKIVFEGRPTRRAMTTPTSRSVSMPSRNYNLNPVIDVRPRW